MANDNFISYWETTLQNGKPKFILKTWLRYFILLFLLDLFINKLIFGDPSLMDFIIDTNWNRVIEKLGVWSVGSLLMSYFELWRSNKKYQKLKSDH